MELDKNIVYQLKKQVTPQISSSHYSEDPYFASNGKRTPKYMEKTKMMLIVFPITKVLHTIRMLYKGY